MTTPTPSAAAVDLEALSRETGVPVDVLRTLAGISDPANEHLFTAESLQRAMVSSSMARLVAAPHAGVARPAVRELRVKK